MYTSAAPTYFASEDGYVDGGVFATNPSMCALAQTQDERIGDERAELHELRLLSLGTGRSLEPIEGDPPRLGVPPVGASAHLDHARRCERDRRLPVRAGARRRRYFAVRADLPARHERSTRTRSIGSPRWSSSRSRSTSSEVSALARRDVGLRTVADRGRPRHRIERLHRLRPRPGARRRGAPTDPCAADGPRAAGRRTRSRGSPIRASSTRAASTASMPSCTSRARGSATSKWTPDAQAPDPREPDRPAPTSSPRRLAALGAPAGGAGRPGRPSATTATAVTTCSPRRSLPGDDFLAQVVRAPGKAATAPAADAGIRVVTIRSGHRARRPRRRCSTGCCSRSGSVLGGRLGSGEQYMSWITLDDERRRHPPRARHRRRCRGRSTSPRRTR